MFFFLINITTTYAMHEPLRSILSSVYLSEMKSPCLSNLTFHFCGSNAEDT